MYIIFTIQWIQDYSTKLGSMPPHSKALWEEGMAVMSFKLVKGGEFQEEGRCCYSECGLLHRMQCFCCIL